MQHFFRLSACLVAAVTLSVASDATYAGGNWNKQKSSQHSVQQVSHKHRWHHWGHRHFVHRPYYHYYYSPRPVIVQQPVYTPPVVVQQAPTTTIVDVVADLKEVPAGATTTLSGRNFGQSTGTVGVAAGELMLAAEVVSWGRDTVTVRVPQLTLAGPARAKFIIFRADGSIADEVPFALLPSVE